MLSERSSQWWARLIIGVLKFARSVATAVGLVLWFEARGGRCP